MLRVAAVLWPAPSSASEAQRPARAKNLAI
jgi:hypothetical protein